MDLLKKICLTVSVYSLVACGDSNLPESDAASLVPQEPVQQEKELGTKRAGLHTIQDMKKVMDDARGVEDLLQKNFEERQKKLNNL